ncbi:MAG: hypothetical protein B0D92_08380 [Spirochaeta sp. LUC14_002_19_P3]|nr:MAG: hypothetical protein B0D92_08380 [Spirochaeta sp. LUC14_002_19_P3]
MFITVSAVFARPQTEADLKPRVKIPSEVILNDPTVYTGTLDNGLTYYVKANDTPANMAELRLAVKVGSIVEDDDQLGLAHLLEHMLFNGTEKYPGNELIEILESFGMEFGPDINAYTTFDETVYRLMVSTEDEEQFASGLDILREWAFHAVIDEEEYEKEKGVVYEEWRLGLGAFSRMLDEMYPVLFKDSRYADRLPIGDMEVVLNVPVSAIRRYYRDWYRPDLMAVIAVGDFDPQEVIGQIEALFGDQQNPDSPRPRQEYSIPRHDDTLVKVIFDKEAVHSEVTAYIKHDTRPLRYKEDYKQLIARELFHDMLAQRLNELEADKDAPFKNSENFSITYNSDISYIGLSASVEEGKQLKGLNALFTEVQRIKQHGFLPTELERAKVNQRNNVYTAWKQRNDRESDVYVSQYLDAFLTGEPYPSLDWEWPVIQEYLPLITLEDVMADIDILADSRNRVVIFTGPEGPVLTGIQEEDILQVLRDTENITLAAWEDKVLAEPLVQNVPQPGSIVERRSIPGTGITDIILSNGARVLYKVTDFKSEEVMFLAVSPGGDSKVEDERLISSMLATYYMQEAGIGNFSQTDLNKVLTGVNVFVETFIDTNFEGLQGNVTTEDLEYLFQLIYLSHTAPRHDDTAWELVYNNISDFVKNRENSPKVLFSDKLQKTLFNDHFRSQPLTMERLEGADSEEAYNIYKERFKEGGDFTYIFVGDINPEQLERYAEKWLASLPAPSAPEIWEDSNLRYFEGSPSVAVEAGTEPLSIVYQIWTGEWDGSYAENYRMKSLAAALNIKLNEVIREEYSGTYSIGVQSYTHYIPVNEYRFDISYSCDPNRVEELSARVKEIIAEWSSTAPEEKYAADIMAAQRRNYEQSLEQNDWWLQQISDAITIGIPAEELIAQKNLFDTLNPQTLQETAKRYFNDDRYLQAVLYPAAQTDMDEPESEAMEEGEEGEEIQE